jgi:hypothetical protein
MMVNYGDGIDEGDNESTGSEQVDDLGDAILKLWEKQCKTPESNFAICGWYICIVSEVLEDVRNNDTLEQIDSLPSNLIQYIDSLQHDVVPSYKPLFFVDLVDYSGLCTCPPLSPPFQSIMEYVISIIVSSWLGLF